MIPILLFFIFGSFVSEVKSSCIVNCLPYVEISAGNYCNATIYPHQLITNYQHYCNYQVTVFSPSGYPLGNTVPTSLIGQTLDYSVYSSGTVCMGTLKVIDNIPPVAICDLDTRVSLGSNGTARVYASAYDDGSYDNCGVQSLLLARMVEGNCPYGVEDDTYFRPYVEVCCNDIYSSPIQVRLKVTDYSGNTNECWADLFVESKSSPTIICPTDVTVSCDSDYYPANLSALGKIADSESEREPIIIHEDWYSPSYVAGIDGVVYGGCGSTVIETVYEDKSCGSGFVQRTFTAHNNSGSSSCTQIINVVETNPFNESNIIWPDDVHLTTCPANNLDPSYTGSPTFTGDYCSLIGVSYKDWVFTIVPDACFKVLRTWSVLDWCQYEPNSYYPVGIWEYTQTIKLMSSNSPNIENIDPVEFCGGNSTSCSGYIEFIQIAEDDCTPDSLLKWTHRIDLNNNGNFDIVGDGNDISGVYPFGTHSVRWIVEDLCGNKRVCDQEFSVNDCKQPTPVCLNGISSVVMPATGEVSLPASVFNKSSFDNCTPSKSLVFAYSNDLSDTVKTFTCDNLDTNEVDIWVIDKEGNADFCRTYIVIGDNQNHCINSLVSFATGQVVDVDGLPVSNVALEFSSAELPRPILTLTDDYGQFDFDWYSFTLPDEGKGYVNAKKTDDYRNGVTTFDLLLIEQHILGVKYFESLPQYIAADINSDGIITVSDLADGRDLILGRTEAFPNADSWVFFPEGSSIESLPIESLRPEKVVEFEFFKDTIIEAEGFSGIKIGDVNRSSVGSAIFAENRDQLLEPLFWDVINTGNGAEIQISTSENLKAMSMQFSLLVQATEDEIKSIEFNDNLSANWEYHVLYGPTLGTTVITVSVYSKNGLEFSNEYFMNLVTEDRNMNLKNDFIKITETPAIAEIALNIDDIRGLVVQKRERTDLPEGEMLELMSIQVFPNPSGGIQNVEIVSKLDLFNTEVVILDPMGREMRNFTMDLKKGTNELKLSPEYFDGPGLYFLQLNNRNNEIAENVKILRH